MKVTCSIDSYLCGLKYNECRVPAEYGTLHELIMGSAVIIKKSGKASR